MSNIRGSDGSGIHLGETLEASDPGGGRVMSKIIVGSEARVLVDVVRDI